MTSSRRQPRVALYLGAGASCFAGYCTFVEFPAMLFEQPRRTAELMPALSPSSDRLLRAIRASLERNNKATTHDNFLWRLDGYSQLLRLNQADDVLQEFLRENTRLFDLHVCTEQAVQQISATTIRHYAFDRVAEAKRRSESVYDNLRRAHGLYRSIAALNGDLPFLPVFTTNYDLLLEDIWAEFDHSQQSECQLINGIRGVCQEQEIWDDQEYSTFRSKPRGVYLHRLHGCVCWFYGSQGDSNVYFRRHDAVHQATETLCAMYPGRETRVGMNPHGYAFRTFYETLQRCELVVFIGFSFRDDDIMHVLLKALSERTHRPKLLIVDRLYNRFDVCRSLEGAATRSKFPTRIPQNTELESLHISYGQDENFDDLILDACKQMLK